MVFCFEPIDPARFASIREAVDERHSTRSRASRSRMTAGLKVLTPGLHTTVQDLGRPGYQAIGVPVSGALDGFSLRLANALVGNPQGSAGARDPDQRTDPRGRLPTPFAWRLPGPARAWRRLLSDRGISRAGRSVTLPRGEVFEVVAGRQSACCYLAAEGAIAVPPVLGSASTYVRAAIGGSTGVRCSAAISSRWRCAAPPSGAELLVCRRRRRDRRSADPRVLGPQQEHFTEEAVRRCSAREFRISQHADRMGMRLARPAAAAIAVAGTSSPTRSPRVPSRCRVRDSRSCCSPTTRRRAATRRSLR